MFADINRVVCELDVLLKKVFGVAFSADGGK
jgi:hypothetical protein